MLFQGFIESGLMLLKPGDAYCDWVHVHNLVQSHLLAMQGLSQAARHVAVSEYLNIVN